MFYKPNFTLGVGVNFRNEICDELVRHLDHFDFIEVGTERFFVEEENPNITKIMNEKPIVLHGITMSMGTYDQEIPASHLEKLADILAVVNCPWFSEHIAVTNVNGMELRSLMPVDFTEQSIDIITKNAKKMMALSNKPFLLENIAYYYAMPRCKMSEAKFISNIVTEADCGILLDLNNLYVNAFNHMYDPYDFIRQLPLDRIVEIHLAACDYMYDMLIDTHASPIRKDVLNLFDYLCSIIPIMASSLNATLD